MSVQTVVRFTLILAALAASLWFFGQRMTWLPGVEPRTFPSLGERRVSAGSGYYVLALSPAQNLYGWGGNHLGQLVNYGAQVYLAPVVIAEDTANWRYVAAGDEASYAITKAGVLLRRLAATSKDQSTDFEPLFSQISTKEQVFWTKVQERRGMTVGLAWNGRLFVWRETELTAGKFCTADPNVECINLDPDGTPRYKTEVELEAYEADRVARLEQVLQRQTEDLQNYWKSQPGGLDSPKAQQSIRELEDTQQKEREDQRAILQRQRATTLSARSIEVPKPIGTRSDWADFCQNGPESAYAVDQAGALWRIDFERVRAFFAEGEIKVQKIPAPAKIQRLFCSTFRAHGARAPYADQVFAIDADQHLWGFGSNEYGALWPELSDVPAPIPENAIRKLSDDRWAMIAPAAGFTVGLRTDGTLWAWGGGYDSVTKNTTRSGKEPIQVGDDENWVEVDAGSLFIVARTAQGELFTWGMNRNGVLGDGGVADHRDNPRPISLPQPPSSTVTP